MDFLCAHLAIQCIEVTSHRITGPLRARSLFLVNNRETAMASGVIGGLVGVRT